MTHYADLTAYEYTDRVDDGETHLNVGWLSGTEPFSKGQVDDDVVRRLDSLGAEPANQFRGSHACDFCLAEITEHGPLRGPDLYNALTEAQALGNGEIVVKGPQAWYHAPVLIAHYVERHGYRPPQEFIDAAMES